MLDSFFSPFRGGPIATVSIKEVAKRAGVSVGTVSNVLNRPSAVSDATRQRVLEAIADLGFVRNESARTLRAGRSRTIGLVVLDIANPFFTDVAHGAEVVADQNDTVVTLCNSGEDLQRERRHLDRLEEQRVQGVLITPVDDGPNPRIDELVARGIPVVLVDRGAGQPNRCSIAVDDLLGGRLAATHLLEQGHNNIAFIGGPLTLRQIADRHAGAAAAVAAGGGSLRVIETTTLNVAAGREAGEELAKLAPSERPTAVFCANDLVAVGMLQTAVGARLRVPNDVAIVGYDDIEYAAAAAVPLSSVRQPREDLGRAAAELLFDEINHAMGHRHRQALFQPQLVARESSVSAIRRARCSGPGPW